MSDTTSNKPDKAIEHIAIPLADLGHIYRYVCRENGCGRSVHAVCLSVGEPLGAYECPACGKQHSLQQCARAGVATDVVTHALIRPRRDVYDRLSNGLRHAVRGGGLILRRLDRTTGFVLVPDKVTQYLCGRMDKERNLQDRPDLLERLTQMYG